MEPQPILDDFSRVLNTPLVHLGDLALTPMLVAQVVLFFVTLVLLSAALRRRVVLKLLTKARVEQGTRYAMARIAGYLVWIVGLLVGLPMLGVKLSTLAVAFGTIGIGVGLGLQKVAENLISGLVLLFGRPIKVGDRIQVGQVVGTVIEIQLRVTLVKTNDNIIILLPNAQLVSDQVTNLTHNDRVVRFSFSVGVAYESDPNTVRECLLQVARDHEGILAEPAPDVLFRGFGDSSLDFTLRGYSTKMVPTPEVLTSEVHFSIWYALKAAGITIPFPQRDLHLRSVSVDAAAALNPES